VELYLFNPASDAATVPPPTFLARFALEPFGDLESSTMMKVFRFASASWPVAC